jgi:hypothetical protein
MKCGWTRQSIDPLLGKTLSVIGRQSIEADSSIPRAIAGVKGQESFGLQVHRRGRDGSDRKVSVYKFTGEEEMDL